MSCAFGTRFSIAGRNWVASPVAQTATALMSQ